MSHMILKVGDLDLDLQGDLDLDFQGQIGLETKKICVIPYECNNF